MSLPLSLSLFLLHIDSSRLLLALSLSLSFLRERKGRDTTSVYIYRIYIPTSLLDTMSRQIWPESCVKGAPWAFVWFLAGFFSLAASFFFLLPPMEVSSFRREREKLLSFIARRGKVWRFCERAKRWKTGCKVIGVLSCYHRARARE